MHVQERPSYEGQAVHFERLPARAPKYRQPATPLSAPVKRALAAWGITQLFEHQAQVQRGITSCFTVHQFDDRLLQGLEFSAPPE